MRGTADGKTAAALAAAAGAARVFGPAVLLLRHFEVLSEAGGGSQGKWFLDKPSNSNPEENVPIVPDLKFWPCRSAAPAV